MERNTRPNLAFAPGKIEIFLRILAITVGSLAALIAASVALRTFEDEFVFAFTDKFQREIKGPTSTVIAITAFAIIMEAAVIWTRFRYISIDIKVLLSIVIYTEILLMAGHIAVGVSTAYYADEHLFDGIAGSIPELVRLRNSMATTSAFCFVAAFLFGFLVIWEIKFLASRWNESARSTQR